MEDVHERFKAAVARRDRARSHKQRIQGKLDAARRQQADIEQECRDRGVPPEQLDASILRLQRRLKAGVDEFEGKVQLAEEQIAPYLED